MRKLARLLVELGIAVSVFGLSKIHAVRHHYSFHGSARFAWAIAYVVVLSVTAYAVGLPDLSRRRSRWVAAGGASLLGVTGVSFLQLFTGDALLPRFVLFGSAALLVPWYVVCALVADGGRARAEKRDRVVVVGRHADAETLRLELDDMPEHPATVVAWMDVPDASAAGRGGEPLVDLAIAEGATVLVLGHDAQEDARIVDQAAVLHEAGVRVRTLAAFYDDWLGKLPIGELERLTLMFDIGEIHDSRYAQSKRMLDVVVGALGLVLFIVLIPFVALGNLIGNRGPLLYRQARIGRDNGRFTIVKFRTMAPGLGGVLGNEWTQADDPRITPFGRVLRRTHLDEVPQMWNIVRGDLSLVGPRPEQPQYVEELEQKIPFYALRHVVRPGLTGWAQVKYGYAGDERDALEKLQYEFFYLAHQGVGLDLRILARTVRDFFGRGGR